MNIASRILFTLFHAVVKAVISAALNRRKLAALAPVLFFVSLAGAQPYFVSPVVTALLWGPVNWLLYMPAVRRRGGGSS